MKKIITTLFFAFGMFASQAQFISATLQASGLTCAMCTKAINKSLEALPFVGSVDADIKSSAFNIRFKPDAPVDIDRLKKAVEEAGFSVAKLRLAGNFSNVDVKNDEHVKISGNTFHFLNVPSQHLNGHAAITIVDKDFVTAKEYKKFSAATHMSCIKTGRAAGCCVKEGVAPNSRIYHATI